MKRTHNEAMEQFKAGNYEQAWRIAQQDEGLNPDVTREQWLKFAAALAKAQAI